MNISDGWIKRFSESIEKGGRPEYFDRTLKKPERRIYDKSADVGLGDMGSVGKSYRNA